MDFSQQLKQLLSPDLPSLGAYYQDLATYQGAGVLVVNYYPSGEVAQMSAKFLKPSSIPRLARQMGLPTLQIEFDRHNQQSQMVAAVITVETKGVVTVELPSIEAQTAPSQPPELQGQAKSAASSKRKSSTKTSTKRKSSAKSTSKQQDEENQVQTQTPESVDGVASSPTAEMVTQPTVVESEAMPEASQEIASTSKPAALRKSSSKTTARRTSPTKLAPKQQQEDAQAQEEPPREATSAPVLEPETTAQPTVELEETTPQASPEVEATSKPAALRKSSSKTHRRGTSPAKLAPKQQQEDTQAQEEPSGGATSAPALEPETVAQPTVEPEAMPQASPEVEATSKPAALRKSSSKTSTRGKSASKTTTRRKTATHARAKRKKES